jgi:hypothetical protein
MVALASAFVSLIPKTDEFRRTAERDLSASGTSAGKGFGNSFSKEAMTNWRVGSGKFIGEGEKTGRETGKRFGSGMASGMGGLGSAVKGLTAAFAGMAAISVFKGFIDEARESVRTGRITESVLKSTGNAAHVTAGHIGDLANAISALRRSST